MKTILSRVVIILSLFSIMRLAQAQGTAFSYQGRLNASGNVANGTYDFKFTLYTNAVTGNAIGGPVTNAAVTVTNGLFSTPVDFGNAFNGASNWIEIAVSTNSANNFTTLTPRQQITPTPYALYSSTAASANTVSAANITGTIPLAIENPAVITNRETGVSLTVSNLSVSATNQIAPLSVLPNQPTNAIGSTTTNNETLPYFLAVAGRNAYVVNANSNTLQIFDVSIPSSPVSVGSVTAGTGPQSVAVAGRYVYVGTSGGLQVFDVSNPSAPVSLGSVGTGGSISCLVVAGRYVYAACVSAHALKIVDVSTPSAPVVVGSITMTGVSSVAVAGRYAYVTTFVGETLQIIDVSTPSAPVSVGSAATEGTAGAVVVVGRYAYVANRSAGTLQIFDVSQPSAPVSVGSVILAYYPANFTVAGRYAYVPNFDSSSIQVVDVSVPTVPVVVNTIGTGSSSSPISVAVSGRYVYVACEGSGALDVFDMGGAYIQQLEAGSAEIGSLQTRDTVTVGNSLDVHGGLTVSSSARISGSLGADSITATNFSGGGSGLTGLNAGNLSSGTVPLTQLSGITSVQLDSATWQSATNMNGGKAALATNVVSGINITNPIISNAFITNSVFAGNGANLTNLNASQLSSGVVAQSVLPGFQFSSNYSTVGGGQNNTIAANSDHADINGGWNNTILANSYEAVISGGYYNTNGGAYSSIGGGQDNLISEINATIAGGVGNNIQSGAGGAVIVGGIFNTNAGQRATIAGGYQNNILTTGDYSAIAGGSGNTALGNYGMIPGGLGNTATNLAFAAGRNAQATNTGSFVWSDGTGTATSSFTNNEFLVRASGGVVFLSGTAASPTSYATGSAGVVLLPGQTAWATVSDENAKKNFASIDYVDVLNKLASVPVEKWNYKWEADNATPNLGPMAQAFKSAFYPGRDDKSITTLEFDGVELAAIQGLNQKLEAQKAENAELKRQLAELKLLVQKLAEKK